MSKRSWKSYLGVAALVVALLFVINPELRALPLLADALGLEVLVFMVATQLRSYWPLLDVAAKRMLAVAGAWPFALARITLRALSLALPAGPFTISLCAALPIVAQNLHGPARPQTT